jgi:TP901 family phage tail tape measure protein
MAFVVPTYFTAIDKFSSPVRAMAGNMDSFISKAEAGVNRNQRAFNKLTPTISDATKQLFSFASTATVVAGMVAAGKSVMDYETELANLQAVTGASGTTFDTFKDKIRDVANQTKSSSVDVAKAFTAIANNQPELLKDADALAKVTKSSIVLAQAAKMDLQPAGEALTQILNQFGKGANEAAKTIDILAAGSVAGSSEIRDTADAIQKFGTVAANAGIKINESVALIELSSKFEKGAEAGQKLRNILITMSTAKVQDPKAVADMARLGVNMNIVSDKSLPLNERLKEMAKVAKDDAAIFHIFGKENQALATGVLNSAGAFGKMLNDVNSVGKAAEMAAKNNETFAIKIEQLKNKFITWVTTSEEAQKSLDLLKGVVGFLADNMTAIIKITGLVIGAFVGWWVWIKILTARIIILRAVSAAFFLTDMIRYVASTQGITFAQAAWAVVTSTVTSAQMALNAAMLANPVALVVVGILALVAALGYVIANYKTIEELHNTQTQKNKLDGIKSETDQINKAAEAYERYGNSAVDAKRKAIKDSREFIVADLAAQREKMSKPMTESQRRIIELSMATNEGRLTAVNQAEKDLGDMPKPQLVNPKTAQTQNIAQSITNTKKEAITIDFKNVPTGVEISSSNNNSSVIPSNTSTMPKH